MNDAEVLAKWAADPGWPKDYNAEEMRERLRRVSVEIEQYRNLHVAALAAYRELDGQGYDSIYELEKALNHLPLPTQSSSK